MVILNWIKIIGIKMADLVNKLVDPWDKFTRPAMPAEGTLKSKAETFAADFLARFFDTDTSSFQYMIPFNPGDQSLWHGIASSMFAFRHHVLGDGKYLEACIKGLSFHQHDGYLMRGRVGETEEWETSNDQASGHLAGLYFTGQKDLAKQWAEKIIAHGYAMTDRSGKVSKYGKLENGILTDPLRLTLLLAILKYAGEETRYKKLLSKYGPLVKYPKVRLARLGKAYDTHRAAIHLCILSELDPECSYYRDGLKRMVAEATQEGNIWVMLLAARRGIPVDVEIIRKVLFEFDVTARLKGNVERLNSTNAAEWERVGIKFVKWGKELQAKQPLPRWTCGSQDFYFQRNLRSVDNWKGNSGADVFHSGLDYLTCYWLARVLGFVSSDE